MITEKQRIAREKGIGSSDIGTILGINPWSTAYDLWLRRTKQVPDIKGNEAMDLGSALEVPILALASKRLDAKIVRPRSVFVGAHKYMRANLDGMIGSTARGSPIVEAKTTGMSSAWGDEGSSDVPEYVKAQVMYQMMCSSSQTAHIACLVGDRGFKLKMFRVEYDSDYAQHILDAVVRFWSCCQTMTAPTGTASLDVLKQIKRNEDAVAEVPVIFFKEEERLKIIADTAQKEADEARARLVVALGTAKRGAGGAYSITMSEVRSERFNAKLFQTEYPDIASKFVTESSHTRISIKKAEPK